MRGRSTTRLAIDEQGIGAIRVGLVSVGTPGTEEQRIIYLDFSRPFAFAVRDTDTGLVLLCGLVRQLPDESRGARDRDR